MKSTQFPPTDRRLAAMPALDQVNSIFEPLNDCSQPGVAAGVLLHGVPQFRRAFGLANMELPLCLSTNTQMRVGSVSKQFTALAYLLLCEDGRAHIDDRIGKYFPQFSPVVRSATAMQLLGHTSGLRDAADMRIRFGGLEGRPVSKDEILSLYEKINELDAEPGTTWIYNNGAYMLLSSIVEMLADMSFGDFLKQRVFSPIGMYDTVVRPWDTDFGTNSATPHTLAAPDRFEKRYWGLEFAGAGSLCTTVDDLLRWLAHMDSPLIGSAETWALMLAPQRLASGASTGYGCGLIHTKYRGVDIICHGGGWIGGNAQALRAPAYGIDVAVISNRSDVFSPVLAHRILDACLPGLDALSSRTIAPEGSEGFSLFRVSRATHNLGSEACHTSASADTFLRGNFLSAASGRVVQLFPRDGRQIVSVDGHDLPYDRLRERELAPIAIWSHVRRTIELLGDPERPSGLRLNDFGSVDDFDRLAATESVLPPGLLGRYRDDAAGATATVSSGEAGLRLGIQSGFGSIDYLLESLTSLVFRITSTSSAFLDAIVSFSSIYDAFFLSSYNVRRLRFARIPETR